MRLLVELKTLAHNIVCLCVSLVQSFFDFCSLIRFIDQYLSFLYRSDVVLLSHRELAILELKVRYVVIAHSCKSMVRRVLLLEVLANVGKVDDCKGLLFMKEFII